MKLLRQIIVLIGLGASFTATAGEQLTVEAKVSANQTTLAELQLLQGTWEGVLLGDSAHQRINISIIGDSLHFHRDTNFWFETTFILPAGKEPRQLHATIKRCPPSQGVSIDQVVRAFFKIENGTLTLATIGEDAEETPRGFDAAGTRYELRKSQPPEGSTQPPQPK